jgi:hypothetical protein
VTGKRVSEMSDAEIRELAGARPGTCTAHAAAMADELAALAGWIDAQLDNDRADRQYVCEETELRLHEIAARLASEPDGRRLTPDQLATLGQVLADAITYRDPAGDCAGCEAHPAGLCEDHAADLDKTDAYLKLAAALGIEVER